MKKVITGICAVLLLLITANLFACSDYTDPNKAQKKELMLQYMQDKYGETFEFVEFNTDSYKYAFMGSCGQTIYVEGMHVKTEKYGYISVVINWQGLDKPEMIVCADNYIYYKYYFNLENQIKSLTQSVFGEELFQMTRPDIYDVSKLPYNTTEEQFLLWYAEGTKSAERNESIFFYTQQQSAVATEAFELELIRLEQYRIKLQEINFNVDFVINYIGKGDEQRVFTYGYFKLDEQFNYVSSEIGKYGSTQQKYIVAK